ncbi:nuclease S1 [Aspergillus spectabilis]
MAPLGSILPITFALTAGLPKALAWGTMGHETIAYIAQNFVASSTATYCKDILGSTSSSYLASVAAWADSYRYTAAGEFSAPFHYIDANDNPPSSCSVEYSRDCGSEGCSISAIQNYTTLLLDSETSDAVKLDALRFIIHIIGDIHQPLHDEALEVGGNDIDVTYDGTDTNLHHIWDSNMPEDDAGGSTATVAKSWASTLTTRITSGEYSSVAASWIAGLDITDPLSTAMVWAEDANAYVCSTVLEPGLEYLKSTDLSGEYYTTAQPVFEELIARAGYRLSAWLDLIAANV